MNCRWVGAQIRSNAANGNGNAKVDASVLRTAPALDLLFEDVSQNPGHQSRAGSCTILARAATSIILPSDCTLAPIEGFLHQGWSGCTTLTSPSLQHSIVAGKREWIPKVKHKDGEPVYKILPEGSRRKPRKCARSWQQICQELTGNGMCLPDLASVMLPLAYKTEFPGLFERPASAILPIVNKEFCSRGQQDQQLRQRFILDTGNEAEPVSTQMKRLQQTSKPDLMSIMIGGGLNAHLDVSSEGENSSQED